jgi:hypothetical protein
MVVTVEAGQLVCFILSEAFDALIGDEVILHPEDFAVGVDPAVGVARIAVHVSPGGRDTAIAEQPGDLVC